MAALLSLLIEAVPVLARGAFLSSQGLFRLVACCCHELRAIEAVELPMTRCRPSQWMLWFAASHGLRFQLVEIDVDR